jgi:Ca2+-dependent lipid-binding protein
MKYIVSFFQFWYDFIVGDDWTIALAVAAGLVVTWVFTHSHMNVWWLLPVVVVCALAGSLWREAAKAVRK